SSLRCGAAAKPPSAPTSRLFPVSARRNNRDLGAFGPHSHQVRGYFVFCGDDITANLASTALSGASGALEGRRRNDRGTRKGADGPKWVPRPITDGPIGCLGYSPCAPGQPGYS